MDLGVNCGFWKEVQAGVRPYLNKTAHLSAETLQARMECELMHKVMKENNLQAKLLYSTRTSFRFDSTNKTLQISQR